MGVHESRKPPQMELNPVFAWHKAPTIRDKSS